jgi:hypothetical protein
MLDVLPSILFRTQGGDFAFSLLKHHTESDIRTQ